MKHTKQKAINKDKSLKEVNPSYEEVLSIIVSLEVINDKVFDFLSKGLQEAILHPEKRKLPAMVEYIRKVDTILQTLTQI